MHNDIFDEVIKNADKAFKPGVTLASDEKHATEEPVKKDDINDDKTKIPDQKEIINDKSNDLTDKKQAQKQIDLNENNIEFIKYINKETGKNFESIEEIKEQFEKFNNYDELLNSIKQKEQILIEKELLLDEHDPIKEYFGGNENAYKVQQLKIKHPDLDTTVLWQIFNEDIKNLSNEKILLLDRKLKNDNFEDEIAKEFIKTELRLSNDFDFDDKTTWTKVDEAIIKNEVKKVKTSFSALSDEIKKPDKVDVLAKRTEKEKTEKEFEDKLKTSWPPILKTLPEYFKNIEIDYKMKIGDKVEDKKFSFTIDDEFRNQLPEIALQELIEQRLEPSKENYIKVWQQIEDYYKVTYLPKILEVHADEIRTQVLEEVYKEKTNTSYDKSKINTKDIPEDGRRKAAKILNLLD